MNYVLVSASIVLPNTLPLQAIVNYCKLLFFPMRVHCKVLSTVASHFLVSDSIVLGCAGLSQISTAFSADLDEIQEVRNIFAVKAKIFQVKDATKNIV